MSTTDEWRVGAGTVFMSPLPLPPSELLDEAPKPPTPPPNRKDPRVPLHNESRTPAHAHVRLGGVSVGVSSSESYHGLGVDDDVEEDSGEYLAPVLLADQEKLASRPGNAYATVLNTEVDAEALAIAQSMNQTRSVIRNQFMSTDAPEYCIATAEFGHSVVDQPEDDGDVAVPYATFNGNISTLDEPVYALSPSDVAAAPADSDTLTQAHKMTDPTCCYTAMYDFESQRDHELSLRAGDVVTVLISDSEFEGWWYGCSTVKSGWFPLAYVAHSPERLGDARAVFEDEPVLQQAEQLRAGHSGRADSIFANALSRKLQSHSDEASGKKEPSQKPDSEPMTPADTFGVFTEDREYATIESARGSILREPDYSTIDSCRASYVQPVWDGSAASTDVNSHVYATVAPAALREALPPTGAHATLADTESLARPTPSAGTYAEPLPIELDPPVENSKTPSASTSPSATSPDPGRRSRESTGASAGEQQPNRRKRGGLSRKKPAIVYGSSPPNSGLVISGPIAVTARPSLDRYASLKTRPKRDVVSGHTQPEHPPPLLPKAAAAPALKALDESITDEIAPRLTTVPRVQPLDLALPPNRPPPQPPGPPLPTSSHSSEVPSPNVGSTPAGPALPPRVRSPPIRPRRLATDEIASTPKDARPDGQPLLTATSDVRQHPSAPPTQSPRSPPVRLRKQSSDGVVSKPQGGMPAEAMAISEKTALAPNLSAQHVYQPDAVVRSTRDSLISSPPPRRKPPLPPPAQTHILPKGSKPQRPDTSAVRQRVLRPARQAPPAPGTTTKVGPTRPVPKARPKFSRSSSEKQPIAVRPAVARPRCHTEAVAPPEFRPRTRRIGSDGDASVSRPQPTTRTRVPVVKPAVKPPSNRVSSSNSLPAEKYSI